MKQRFTLGRGGLVLCVAFLVVVMACGTARAQRTVNIPPGFGTLNSTIMGDTLATGARVDSSTVYRLVRGGLYILNGTMDHRYPVTSRRHRVPAPSRKSSRAFLRAAPRRPRHGQPALPEHEEHLHDRPR